MDPRLRYDRSSTMLSKPERLSDGTMVYDAVLSRAGVLKYRNDDGSWRGEYRPPDEVFKPESMKSFELMAAVVYHPNGEAVSVENRTKYQVGTIVPGTLRRDGNLLLGKMHITDKTAIERIESGMTPVSLGYFQDRVPDTGVAPEDGLPYQYRQTNIRGNHVAIVDVARAGDDARIRVDGITANEQEEHDMDELKKALARVMELEIENQKQKLRIDALEPEITTLKKTADKLTADLETATDKLTKSEKLRTDGEKNARDAARARIKLEDIATKHLTVDGEAPDLTKLTDREIQAKVITKLTGKEVAADKSADYVSARFDGLTEDQAEREQTDKRAVSEIADVARRTTDASEKKFNADGSPNLDAMTAAEMRKYNSDRNANRWKTSDK